MRWEWWLAIVGSGASIIGAGLSLWAAIEARRAATKTKRIESELIFRASLVTWTKHCANAEKELLEMGNAVAADAFAAFRGKMRAFAGQIAASATDKDIRSAAIHLGANITEQDTVTIADERKRMLELVAELSELLRQAQERVRRGAIR